MISGAAAADFNNDGWMDLFIIGGGNHLDGLFINQGNGTFQDVAVSAGVAGPQLGSGVAVGDYDNDGDVDIFVTSFGVPEEMGPGHHRLYRNNGDLTFTNMAAEAGVNRTSPELPDGLGASFGDYDLDGDLDLFVAGWRKPDGKPALGNRLFRNNGDGTFTDVTTEAGIVDDGIRGFNPCFADMDGDRFPEILLSADFGTSRYFHNNANGTFTDVTNKNKVDEVWSGMGAAVADLNNDGMLDWYVTAIFDDENVGRGDGNKLYLNQGKGKFSEAASSLGLADGGWGWGALILDLNNDTRPDIMNVNGWDLEAYANEATKVWLQQPDGTFLESAAAVGLNAPTNNLGLLNLDYDNDGDQDLLTTAYNDAIQLYRNDLTGADTHWLRVRLDTGGQAGLAPDGVGSRVSVRVGDTILTRYQSGCSHYLTQSEQILHFGLGPFTVVDELVVGWANGAITHLTGLPADQILTITPTSQ